MAERLPLLIDCDTGIDDSLALLYACASPATTVRMGRERRDVAARIASKAEAAELWPRLDRVNPTYADYRKMTARPISIVILEPPR